ncbi:MAG: Helix-turn-helix domain [Bacteroidota bacterium]|jgi:excisionase family DNA binding protein
MQTNKYKILTTEVQDASVVPNLESFGNDLNSSLIDVPGDKIGNSLPVGNEDVNPIQSELVSPESKTIFPSGYIPKPFDENFVVDSQNHLSALTLLLGRTTMYLHLLERYDLKYNYSKKYKEGQLNVVEVSEILRLSRSSIYRLIKTKKLKAYKLYNREWYFKMSHVDEYIRKYVLW